MSAANGAGNIASAPPSRSNFVGGDGAGARGAFSCFCAAQPQPLEPSSEIGQRSTALSARKRQQQVHEALLLSPLAGFPSLAGGIAHTGTIAPASDCSTSAIARMNRKRIVTHHPLRKTYV